MHLASGAVITDATRVTGSDAIDPLNRVISGLTPSNVTSQSTLEATAGFGAVQTFTGFTSGTNILSFTDSNLPDVQFSFTGSSLTADTGSSLANTNFVTSNSDSIRFESNLNSPSTTAREMTAVMTFGDWDGSAFTAATTGSLVAPQTVGFTFASQGSRMYMFDSIVATFKGLDGSTIQTQSLEGLDIVNDANVYAGYFGYQGPTQIGSVELTIITQEIAFLTTAIVGIDDFGFAVIR
jgi:hypothetical protein